MPNLHRDKKRMIGKNREEMGGFLVFTGRVTTLQ